MRYNPPPNWPPPPSGWEPSPTWTPNPAWPPPPPGWQLFLDEDAPDAPVPENPADPPPSLTEIGAEDLTVDHLGARATARWEDPSRYKIGTIVGISADAATIAVQLSGSEAIAFPRDASHGGPSAPRLYVST